jgi:tRNA nucleotidyltransferase (CCA-adding enzyme)
MGKRIMGRMGLSADMIRRTCALVRYHDNPMRHTARSVRRMLALLEEAAPGKALAMAHDMMVLKRSDAVSKQPKCAWYAVELDEMDRILADEARRGTTLRVSDLAIGGHEVMEVLGGKPGPMVGMTLSQLLQAVIDDEVENTREALMGELWRMAQESE